MDGRNLGKSHRWLQVVDLWFLFVHRSVVDFAYQWAFIQYRIYCYQLWEELNQCDTSVQSLDSFCTFYTTLISEKAPTPLLEKFVDPEAIALFGKCELQRNNFMQPTTWIETWLTLGLKNGYQGRAKPHHKNRMFLGELAARMLARIDFASLTSPYEYTTVFNFIDCLSPKLDSTFVQPLFDRYQKRKTDVAAGDVASASADVDVVMRFMASLSKLPSATSIKISKLCSLTGAKAATALPSALTKARMNDAFYVTICKRVVPLQYETWKGNLSWFHKILHDRVIVVAGAPARPKFIDEPIVQAPSSTTSKMPDAEFLAKSNGAGTATEQKFLQLWKTVCKSMESLCLGFLRPVDRRNLGKFRFLAP